MSAQSLNYTHITNGYSIGLNIGTPLEEVLTPILPDSFPGFYAIGASIHGDTIFGISKTLGDEYAVMLEIPVSDPQNYAIYNLKNETGNRYFLGICFSLTQDWVTGELIFNDIASKSSSSVSGSTSAIIRAKRGRSNEYVITSRTNDTGINYLDLAYSPWHGVVGVDTPNPDDVGSNDRPIVQAEQKRALSQLSVVDDNSAPGLTSYPYDELGLLILYDSTSFQVDCSVYNPSTGQRLGTPTLPLPVFSEEAQVFDAASSWPDSLYVSMSFEEEALAPCTRGTIRVQVVDARRNVRGDSVQMETLLPVGMTVANVSSSTSTPISWQQLGQVLSLTIPWTERSIEDFEIEYSIEVNTPPGAHTVQADVFLSTSTNRYTRSDEPLIVGKRNPSSFQILPIDTSDFTTIEFFDLCKNEEVSIELPESWISLPASWEDGNSSVPARIISEDGIYSATISTACGDRNYTADVRQGTGEVEISIPDALCTLADVEIYTSVDYTVTDWQLQIGGEVIEEGEQLPSAFEAEPFRSGDTIIFTVFDELGCQYSSSVEAQISTCYGFPTAFSPDGNGINDLFGPLSDLAITGTLLIFDRWGNQVFAGEVSTLDDASFWDGTFKGKPMNPGAFAFTFEIIAPQDLSKEFITGDIILVR